MLCSNYSLLSLSSLGGGRMLAQAFKQSIKKISIFVYQILDKVEEFLKLQETRWIVNKSR